MATLDVFRGRLRVDEFCAIESDWTFYVYDDGTLHVEIVRPENWRETHSDGEDVARLEKELEYSYVCYDGVARAIENDDGGDPAPDRSIGGASAAYSSEFFLAKCAAEGESWTERFEGMLLPTSGFRGHWRHESHQGYQFWRDSLGEGESHVVPNAAAWSSSNTPLAVYLAPLTHGKYSLEGSLMDDENAGFIVPMRIDLQLLPDRTLAGSCLTFGGESQSGDVAELSGSWTSDRVDILCAHHFPDSPDEVFALHGTVSPYKITGVWVVEELEALGEWEDSEHQRFHMRVTKMCRPWTRDDHKSFPLSFKTVVRICLLSALRRQAHVAQIPNVIWPRIFSFCNSSWFD